MLIAASLIGLIVGAVPLAGICARCQMCPAGAHYRWAQLRCAALLGYRRNERTSEENCHCKLYDLAPDPSETRDLADKRSDMVKKLENELDKWLKSFKRYEPPPLTLDKLKQLSPKELEAMRGLGYIR